MKQNLSLFFLKYLKNFFPLHWEYTSNSWHLRSSVTGPFFICRHLCTTVFLILLPQSDPATCQPPSPSPGSHAVKFYLRSLSTWLSFLDWEGLPFSSQVWILLLCVCNRYLTPDFSQETIDTLSKTSSQAILYFMALLCFIISPGHKPRLPSLQLHSVKQESYLSQCPLSPPLYLSNDVDTE